jgi:hypothetical protein
MSIGVEYYSSLFPFEISTAMQLDIVVDGLAERGSLLDKPKLVVFDPTRRPSL